MIEIPITEEMLKKATLMANDLGLLKNSIRKGDGNICGFLGELAVLEYLRDSKFAHDFNHDIMYKGFYLEVKSKERTVAPKEYYEVSVADYNSKQRSDAYVFTSVYNDNGLYVSVFLLGWKTPKDYFDKATFWEAGQVDPANNFTVKANMWNMKIKDLEMMEIL